MRLFQVTTYTTVKNEDIVLEEYVKVPNQKVEQFLKDTLELDLYDEKIPLKECQVSKNRWECPVGDFVVTEHFNEKTFNKLKNSRTVTSK